MVRQRALIVLFAGAALAGCGSSSGAVDPIASMHLSHAVGPFPGTAAVYVPGFNPTRFAECNNLWGYLAAHPRAAAPAITPAHLREFRLAGDQLKRALGPAALGEYARACNALFGA